jgi:hypothetical protein
MTLAMEKYLLLDPMDVGLFGAVAVMTDTDQVSDLVEKLRHCEVP